MGRLGNFDVGLLRILQMFYFVQTAVKVDLQNLIFALSDAKQMEDSDFLRTFASANTNRPLTDMSDEQ